MLVEEIRQKVIFGIGEALKNPLNIATVEDNLSANYDYMVKVGLGVDAIIGNKDGIDDLDE